MSQLLPNGRGPTGWEIILSLTTSTQVIKPSAKADSSYFIINYSGWWCSLFCIFCHIFHVLTICHAQVCVLLSSCPPYVPEDFLAWQYIPETWQSTEPRRSPTHNSHKTANCHFYSSAFVQIKQTRFKWRHVHTIFTSFTTAWNHQLHPKKSSGNSAFCLVPFP